MEFSRFYSSHTRFCWKNDVVWFLSYPQAHFYRDGLGLARLAWLGVNPILRYKYSAMVLAISNFPFTPFKQMQQTIHSDIQWHSQTIPQNLLTKVGHHPLGVLSVKIFLYSLVQFVKLKTDQHLSTWRGLKTLLWRGFTIYPNREPPLLGEERI